MIARGALFTLMLACLCGIILVISNVYIVGFQLSTMGAHAVHLAAFAFALILIFSFFSSRFAFARRIKILFKLFNMVVALVFYTFPLAVALSIVLAVGHFSSAASIALSWIAVAIAAALGVIGIAQARTIHTKTYDVALPNAPASWQGRTAVLVSDTHFGLIRHRRFAEKVVRKIRSLAPNFVLHAGDFYDGPMVELPPVTAPWKALAHDIPIFYTPGNHEQYGDFNAFVTSVRETGAAALLDAKTIYDGVQIAGITYRGKTQKQDAIDAIKKLALDPAQPAILINHPPTFHADAVAAGVNLMVSGHTHQGQFWPLNYIVRAFYGIYTYGSHRVDSMTGITTRGVGTAGPPCRLFFPAEIVILRFNTAK